MVLATIFAKGERAAQVGQGLRCAGERGPEKPLPVPRRSAPGLGGRAVSAARGSRSGLLPVQGGVLMGFSCSGAGAVQAACALEGPQGAPSLGG